MIPQNIEYFIAVAESGSVSKAAEKLYISQPSLSQYLKRLEGKLGVSLFDHSSSPLKLSYIGERYYDYVLQVRRMDENIRQEMKDIQDEAGGRLRLGMALWRGACFLPDIFPAFHVQYPKIRIELFEGRFNQLQGALMSDNIDIAVAPVSRDSDFRNLTFEALFEERILLAVPLAHPLTAELQKRYAKGYLAPDDCREILAALPLIMTKPGQNLTYAIDQFLAKYYIENEVLLDTGNLTTAINLCAEGIACTFVPEEGAKICQREGKIEFFAVKAPELLWDIVAVYKKGAYLNNVSRIFIDYVKSNGI